METLKRSAVNLNGSKKATILNPVSLEHCKYPEKSMVYFSVSPNHELSTVPHTYELFVLKLHEFKGNGFVLSQVLQIGKLSVLSTFVVSTKIVVSFGKPSVGWIMFVVKQPSQLYSFEQLENADKYINRVTALKKDISFIIFIKVWLHVTQTTKALCICKFQLKVNMLVNEENDSGHKKN